MRGFFILKGFVDFSARNIIVKSYLSERGKNKIDAKIIVSF